MAGRFWEGSESLATSALDRTGNSSVNSAICDDDCGELLLDVGSVCTPGQGLHNPRLNVQKKDIVNILVIENRKGELIVYTRREGVRSFCVYSSCPG